MPRINTNNCVTSKAGESPVKAHKHERARWFNSESQTTLAPSKSNNDSSTVLQTSSFHIFNKPRKERQASNSSRSCRSPPTRPTPPFSCVKREFLFQKPGFHRFESELKGKLVGLSVGNGFLCRQSRTSRATAARTTSWGRTPRRTSSGERRTW